jgi:predicted SnoaL-like aldol condensation-catalyzing enzyme
MAIIGSGNSGAPALKRLIKVPETPAAEVSIMKRLFPLMFACGIALLPPVTHAQAPVLPAPNADALFTSPDPKLNANKQVVYHMIKDVLEAGHWELADRYLTAEYIQHDPLAQSGRDAVVKFFVDVLHVKPKPIPEHLLKPIVSVTAEGDLVTVAYPHEVKDPKDPSKNYTTTWFDMWRIKDGKADEHWDCVVKP